MGRCVLLVESRKSSKKRNRPTDRIIKELVPAEVKKTACTSLRNRPDLLLRKSTLDQMPTNFHAIVANERTAARIAERVA